MEDLKRYLNEAGLSMNAICENNVRQISGDALANNKQESLGDSVERELKRQVLRKDDRAYP